MSHPTAYTTPGKAAAIARKRFRREVAAGRASWADAYEHDDRGRLAVHPEVAAHGGPPVAPRRQPLAKGPSQRKRPFGQGVLASHPSHRAPADFDSMAWWEEESNREIERDIERRFAEFVAMDRLSNGYDPY
jgi:hypothetical protein